MRRACLSVLAAAACSLSLSLVEAQVICGPPSDLLVCQDIYGPVRRVNLTWRNGGAFYTAVRVYMDGTLMGTGPGTSGIAYLDRMPLGSHLFAVEGVCGNAVTPRATRSFTVLASTPNTQPVTSVDCSYDAARKRITARLVYGTRPILFLDVYLKRAGSPSLPYVKTYPSNPTILTVDDALETDSLRLQFFDMDCYGSELVGCTAPPGPSCQPPLDLQVCQDLYGARSRVFLRWELPDADSTSFEIFLDGTRVATLAGVGRLFHIQGVAPGMHRFGVRGMCGAAPTATASRDFQVLEATPHAVPIANLHCQYDPSDSTLAAVWLPGQARSRFIDVYVRTPGAATLDFVATLPGDRTRVRIARMGPDDEVVLQFFNDACYGSPLLSCGDEAGSRDFLRGDTDGSGTVDLSDAVSALGYLFLGEGRPLCLDASDATDDARVNIADPIYILSWLFGPGPAPPLPGPAVCGSDPTQDAFPACLTAACP